MHTEECQALKFDTSKEGLETLMKPYQATLMEHIWELNENERTGIVSREAHQHLLDTGDDELKVSRASAFYFLEDMVEEGVLEYEMRARAWRVGALGCCVWFDEFG